MRQRFDQKHDRAIIDEPVPMSMGTGGRIVHALLGLFVLASGGVAEAAEIFDPWHTPAVSRRLAIPILGTMLTGDREVRGIVVHVQVEWMERHDHAGLHVAFRSIPGRFSPRAQQSVIQATSRAAQAAGLPTDRWTIVLTFLHPDVTLYGDSLSAMIGLCVVALARGDPLYPDRVITGTITETGELGMVGGVPHKIVAAHARQLRRVVIPEELPVTDGDWHTPFLMHVSPVGNVRQAYHALTDRPL